MKLLLCLSGALTMCSMSAAYPSYGLRHTLSLDGEWEFRKELEDSARTANIPGSWQVNFPDLRDYVGSAEYRKTVTIPSDWKGDPWIIFGAVDYTARVVVNNRYVGFHEGGYTPFAFNLANYVRPGEPAVISLTVEDSGPNQSVKGYPFDEIPHGKQSWYGNVSGPWQSITLEERAPAHVKNLKVTPKLSTSTAALEITLSQTPPGASGYLAAAIYAPGGTPVWHSKISLSSAVKYTMTASIPNPELWTPDNPALYTVNISVVTDNGASVDQFSDRFGMRSFEAKDGVFQLNGKPIFLAGVLDQDFYPLTQYTVPSEAYLRDEFAKVKRIGFNLLRCHIKVPDPIYLKLADEMGLLVWYEIPNPKKLTPKSRARIIETMRDMTDRDYNHPSWVIVSIMNESWGIDLKNADQRKWLISAYDYTKRINPGRLVVDNSPCSGNFHMKSDIEDFHAYYNIPDAANGWASWIKELSSRPDWTFSPYGDAVRTGNEPLMVSEFGNWGLPSLQALSECYSGELPWWFETGSGAVRPEGTEKRYRVCGLENLYGDYAKFARATQELQLLAFKWQIEELRKYPRIAGYVWTELTDLQWESNGIMDYCRNLKASARASALVQDSRCVFSRLKIRNPRSGARVVADTYLSNFGLEVPPGSRIEWQLEGFPDVKGTLEITQELNPASAAEAGEIEFTAPEVAVPRATRLLVKWINGTTTLARNYEDLNIFPKNDVGRIPLAVYIDSTIDKPEVLKKWLKEHGASVAAGLINADVAITKRFTQELKEWTLHGGRTILIADNPSALGRSIDGLRILSRSQHGWDGNWCSSFIWIAKSHAFSRVPTRTQLLDWGFNAVIPRYVIDGVSQNGGWDDVESGIVVGWVHNAAALTMRAGNNSSRLLITTFPLLDALDNDAMASLLLNNLFEEISAESFKVSGTTEFSHEDPETLLIPDAREGGSVWKYTFETPPAGWESPDFNDHKWKEGRSGFGTSEAPGTTIGTIWNGQDIWLRWSGRLTQKPVSALLSVHHDEDVEVYANGRKVWSETGFTTGYADHKLSDEVIAGLEPGPIVIAVHCKQTAGGQYIDVGFVYKTK